MSRIAEFTTAVRKELSPEDRVRLDALFDRVTDRHRSAMRAVIERARQAATERRRMLAQITDPELRAAAMRD